MDRPYGGQQILIPPSTGISINYKAMRPSLLASTGGRDTADESKRRSRAVNVLCDEILETMPCRHGNVGMTNLQASKLLTAKLDRVQLPQKIETHRAKYKQLADGRDYGPEMKDCALNVMKNIATGSVESTHTAAFIAMSADTNKTVDFMVKALAKSLPEDAKRDFAESRGLQNIEDVYAELVSDYVDHQLALVEASCKVSQSFLVSLY